MDHAIKVKKILFFDFANLQYGGGCEKNFMRLGRWLADRDHEVTFMSPSTRLNEFFSLFPGICRYTPNFSEQDLEIKFGVGKYFKIGLRDLLFPTKAKKEMVKFINETDVIITKNEIFEIMLLKFFLKVNFKKVVFGFHTPTYYPATKSLKGKLHNIFYNSRLYFYILKRSKARLLVLRETNKKFFLRGGTGNLTEVIPNSIDIKKFFQKEYKKNEKFRLYFIGRMTEQKGVDTLASVIGLLSSRKEFENMEFHFVGRGEAENFLCTLPDKFGNCFFHGFQADVIPYYQAADLMLVPSRWEGFPYVILEAQSCGVPVLTTDISGCKEIVEKNKTGWVCRVDDVNEIATAVLDAYSLWNENFSDFARLGLNARTNVVEKFEENAINEKILKFISS